MNKKFPPLFTFVGSSGSGKTTFIENLIPIFVDKGLKVGAIKHDAHKFEIDKPGKDSYRLKHAGAKQVLISSKEKIAAVIDTNRDIPLKELILKYFTECDIIITEGYKKSSIPKFEVYRIANGKNPLCLNDETLIGVITDSNINTNVRKFLLNDYEKVAEYILTIANIQDIDIEINCDDEILKNILIDKCKNLKFFSHVQKIKINVEFD
ncbi:molybdopterin-guanine dinucleotide biosynthesis protein B [Deferribacter desulfuricans SSM1]|uniref:Molybdopterin-guanine dinucleotide biosynthesis protein B n=1 Tax=Deferribacter desulfuricans (strain DSM 14783 / JCM 11476 / NBRC 101012 / SSM1) TaxID=639282 RepID=D3P9R2_DEFDS|nr:molybdopterin-guanine dinucleotide biosynthesis protein B [Deferribacter desulfuricans]BAI81452.1 molybdopterin-guanine dinucleotide biosynthesis protein B [Deferribacter desulfuricans SSM1]